MTPNPGTVEEGTVEEVDPNPGYGEEGQSGQEALAVELVSFLLASLS